MNRQKWNTSRKDLWSAHGRQPIYANHKEKPYHQAENISHSPLVLFNPSTSCLHCKGGKLLEDNVLLDRWISVDICFRE